MQIKLTQLLQNNNVTGSDVMVTDVSGPLGYITRQTTVDKLSNYISSSIKELRLNSISSSIGQFTVITASIISASQYIGIVGGGGSGDVSATASNIFTGVNTFNNNYLTATVGITASVGNFEGLSASFIYSSLIPFQNEIFDLGSNTNRWRNLHLSGTTIYLGEKSLSVVNNKLLFNGEPIITNSTSSTATITSSYITASNIKSANVETINLQTVTVATNIFKITGDYDLSANPDKHIILVDATSGDITASLPLAAAVPQRQYIFKKIDSTENTLVVSSSTETLDGDSFKELIVQYETLNIISDGTASWFVL